MPPHLHVCRMCMCMYKNIWAPVFLMQTYLHRTWKCWCLVAKTLKSPPFSLETSCLSTPTHRLQYVYTLLYRIPKWVHDQLSFPSVRSDANLNLFSLFLFSLLFLKSAVIIITFPQPGLKIIEIAEKKKHSTKKNWLNAVVKSFSLGLSYTKLQIWSPDHEWHWAAAITASTTNSISSLQWIEI
jgi:hypothetical protein